MNCAPILLTVYDRPRHFQSCIESIARNREASETILYISSDGPSGQSSYANVSLVRQYIKSVTGFKKIITFLPPENTGGAIKTKAWNEIRSNHSKYIFSEDDNVFSNFALDFFNKALIAYEDNEKIISVSGYMYPGFPAKTLEQIYLQCVSYWGVGLWRDKDLPPSFDEVSFSREILIDKYLFGKVNRTLPHMAPMIKAIAEERLKTSDVTRANFAVRYDKLSIYPSVSLIRNTGNDGSGANCGINDAYSKQAIANCFIELNFDKPIMVVKQDERWLSKFLGGKKAELYGWLIFWELNATNTISLSIAKIFLKCYGLFYRLGILK
jgi:hypothetical protein